MPDHPISVGDDVVIIDAFGQELATRALSGLESKGHSFPVVWVERRVGTGTEPAPWPAEAVRRA